MNIFMSMFDIPTLTNTGPKIPSSAYAVAKLVASAEAAATAVALRTMMTLLSK